ncbi:wings apart-like protein regulation of heterochromatin-domain-containing protein [Myxozyma melibiosi]|uniref:Wings apart-like protein regulation of heterochromatin-domain-containing protein n=1 Tax=Myxozyma melibiosi TaxID=54550 RepID=A0ABR1EYZ7_9ASCO
MSSSAGTPFSHRTPGTSTKTYGRKSRIPATPIERASPVKRKPEGDVDTQSLQSADKSEDAAAAEALTSPRSLGLSGWISKIGSVARSPFSALSRRKSIDSTASPIPLNWGPALASSSASDTPGSLKRRRADAEETTDNNDVARTIKRPRTPKQVVASVRSNSQLKKTDDPFAFDDTNEVEIDSTASARRTRSTPQKGAQVKKPRRVVKETVQADPSDDEDTIRVAYRSSDSVSKSRGRKAKAEKSAAEPSDDEDTIRVAYKSPVTTSKPRGRKAQTEKSAAEPSDDEDTIRVSYKSPDATSKSRGRKSQTEKSATEPSDDEDTIRVAYKSHDTTPKSRGRKAQANKTAEPSPSGKQKTPKGVPRTVVGKKRGRSTPRSTTPEIVPTPAVQETKRRSPVRNRALSSKSTAAPTEQSQQQPTSTQKSKEQHVSEPFEQSPAASNHSPSPEPLPKSPAIRRPISPPPLEDLEFDTPEEPPKTPTIAGGRTTEPSPRLTSRQSEAWDMLDQTSESIRKRSSPVRKGVDGETVSGSGNKLFRMLAAKKDAGPKQKTLMTRSFEEIKKDSERSDGQEKGAGGDAVELGSSLSQSSQPTYVMVRPGKRTYGSYRSYIDDSPATQTPSGSRPGTFSEMSEAELLSVSLTGKPATGTHSDSERESDDEAENENNDSIRVKSIHELRASGTNAKFMDDMEYLLDGLRPTASLSTQRMTYLELALKLTDNQFMHKFKAGGFLTRLASAISQTRASKDAVSSFALSYVLCNFLGDEGIMRSLVSEAGVVEFLVEFVGDGEDVLKVATRAGSGVSKISQSMLRELRTEIIKSIPSTVKPSSISRRLIALTGLLELTDSYFQFDFVRTAFAESKMRDRVIDALAELVKPKQGLEFHDIALCLSVLENSAELAAKQDSGEPVESETLTTATARLLGLLPKLEATPQEAVVVAILKFAILMTNSGSTAVCLALGTDETVAYANRCVERAVCAEQGDGAETEEYGLAANVAVFSIGLLVNLCESKESRDVISKPEHLRKLVSLFEKTSPAENQANYMDDIRGYLALVLALAPREKVKAEGGAGLLSAVGSALEVFKESTAQMQEDVGMSAGAGAGRGMVAKITSVLSGLYE